jgi:hypothetical protein
MRNTGVFMTAEELTEVKKLHEAARTTPVIALSVGQGLAGNDFSAMAWRDLHDRLTALARAHGLPDIPGEWGVTQQGEFVQS